MLPNHDVLRQLGREREAMLRGTTLLVVPAHPERRMRRWVGHLLVRAGAWLANEPMRPVRAR